MENRDFAVEGASVHRVGRGRRNVLLAGLSMVALGATKAKAKMQEAKPLRIGVLNDMSGIYTDISRSEEHTSELQSLMRISYAVFCLKKKIIILNKTTH